MVLDFGKLNAGAGGKPTDPRKIFTTLKRDPRFKRPLDEQADVLDSWYVRRAAKNITLKMNTGAGKTVVGLLCLQSCLNENVKPAVYGDAWICRRRLSPTSVPEMKHGSSHSFW